MEASSVDRLRSPCNFAPVGRGKLVGKWMFLTVDLRTSEFLLAIAFQVGLAIITRTTRLVYSIVGLLIIPIATAFVSFPSAFEVRIH